ncbi:MAG: hypothetical protein ACLR23_05910 [Clostridia bacterium]
MQLSASVTLKGTEIANQDVTWTVSGNKSTSTTIDTNGLLTVGADEPFETILTIYAESQEMAGLRTYKTITVKPLDFEDIPSVTAGSTTTVTIDGVEWYVLVKDNGKALLWAKDPVEQREFNNSTSNAWQNSALRTYLNGTWLNKTTVLKEKLCRRISPPGVSITPPLGLLPRTRCSCSPRRICLAPLTKL